MFPPILEKNIKKKSNTKKNSNTKPTFLARSLKFCSICLEELQNASIDYSVTKCNHTFCTSCLLKHSKYSNICPLCRIVLSSPNTKFKIPFDVAGRIVSKELVYYNDYIEEGSTYVMDTIQHHIKNDSLDSTVKKKVTEDIKEMFENFGMGVCLNVNTTFNKLNVFNTGSPIHRTVSVFDLSNVEQQNISLENTIVRYNDD